MSAMKVITANLHYKKIKTLILTIPSYLGGAGAEGGLTLSEGSIH
jgi:hypothetical protein